MRIRRFATYPVLLPHDTVKPAYSSVLAVCSVGCFTGVACYYLVAIVPWEWFSIGEYIFEIGVVTGAALILLVSGLSVLFKAKASMFRFFPYYLVFAIVGLTLFQSHESLYPVAFVVGLSVSSLLEISLIMYFGTLMRRGFFAPALAVTFSLASIRIGIALDLLFFLHIDIFEQLSSFMDTHLVIDMPNMRVHRVRRYIELVRDTVHSVAPRDQLQNLTLAL